jgi:hypothetical protein
MNAPILFRLRPPSPVQPDLYRQGFADGWWAGVAGTIGGIGLFAVIGWMFS